MACSKEVLRIILWMSWITQWLLSSIFVALTLAAFTRLWQASSLYMAVSGANVWSNLTWRAPMSACLLSALLVLGFTLTSCVILIKKSVNRAGPGFGYGFIVAFCFCLSFFLLLAGLVMDSFRGQVKTLSTYDWTLNGTNTDGFKWESYDSQTFIGAEVFALINFVTMILFAIVLVVLQAGVSEQLGMNKTQYTPLGATPPVVVPPAMEGGYVDPQYAGQDQYGYENQYGYDEHQGLRSEYQGQSSSSAYYASNAAAQAAPQATVGGGYYGHAAYGQVTSDYTYQAPVTEDYPSPPPAAATALGSSLLGGMTIGTSPAPAAVAPPPYHAYQQQL